MSGAQIAVQIVGTAVGTTIGCVVGMRWGWRGVATMGAIFVSALAVWSIVP